MKFIRASLKDFEIIRNIVHSTIRSIYPHYYPIGVVEFFLNHHSDENIKKGIENETVLLQEADGIIVGTGSVNMNEICRMFILPEYQGQGLGTLLINELENIIKEKYSEIILHSSLPAYDLYLKRGYTPIKYNKIVLPNRDVLCFNIMRKIIET